MSSRTAHEVLADLRAAGLEVKANGQALEIRPASALTDELRTLTAENKAALLELLAPNRKPAVAWADDEQTHSTCEQMPSVEFQHEGHDCSRCANLELLFQWNTGGRRQYYWNCRSGHGLLDLRKGGERVFMSPASCVNDFAQWKG